MISGCQRYIVEVRGVETFFRDVRDVRNVRDVRTRVRIYIIKIYTWPAVVRNINISRYFGEEEVIRNIYSTSWLVY